MRFSREGAAGQVPVLPWLLVLVAVAAVALSFGFREVQAGFV